MPDPASLIQVTTSEERWLRWQQRGRDQDARLMRRARRLVTAMIVLLIAVAAFVLSR